MKIKALKPFCYRNSTTGELTSYACGQIAEVATELGNSFINDGLAEAYTLVSPTGTKSITENDTYDVSEFASAIVYVPYPSTGILNVEENGTADVTDYASVTVNVAPVTVTYNVNGGTGTVSPETVGKGTEIELNNGSGITAPSEKQFAGWATTAGAETPDVTSPYKVTADVTLYAVYVAN